MSERYGTIDELPEVLEGLEDFATNEVEKERAELRRVDGLGDPRFSAGRLDAFRDVLDYLGVSGLG